MNKIKKIFYDEIDSTNVELQRLAGNSFIEEFTCIIADKQTRGKGQGNNSWQSNDGGLYFSFIIRPKENLALISLLTGLAVLKTLKIYLKEVEIKWPNDILIKNKKICGILTEGKFKGSLLDYIIIGCGININQTFFEDISNNTPTSLFLETKKEFNKNIILDSFFDNFIYYYGLSEAKKENIILDEINENLYNKNNFSKIKKNENEIILGKILKVNYDGSLLVEYLDEEIKIYSGNILT